MASPMPDVPPTKTATGAGVARWANAALVARVFDDEVMFDDK